jgi:ETC complex I subunit conserved region
MRDRAAPTIVLPRPNDNQSRNQPRLPGTSVPASAPLPLAHIYQSSPSPTQSGRGRQEWVLEFEPSSPPEIEPLMGWVSSRDPFAHIRLRFPDRESAIEFAERQGWPYVANDPPARRVRPKNYIDTIRYGLADAITRAAGSWDGSVAIAEWPWIGDTDIGADQMMSGSTPGSSAPTGARI